MKFGALTVPHIYVSQSFDLRSEFGAHRFRLEYIHHNICVGGAVNQIEGPARFQTSLKMLPNIQFSCQQEFMVIVSLINILINILTYSCLPSQRQFVYIRQFLSLGMGIRVWVEFYRVYLRVLAYILSRHIMTFVDATAFAFHIEYSKLVVWPTAFFGMAILCYLSEWLRLDFIKGCRIFL